MNHEFIVRNMAYNMDVRKGLKQVPDESISCCISSPPYWTLRDYNLDPVNWDDGSVCVLGSEETIKLYLKHLCDIYDQVKRVLKPTGTCFVNLGDSYENKCLNLIPQRFAIEMTSRGWILRNTIIWQKPNAIPQSATDRFTIDFEHVFFFTKQRKYWFDQDTVREPLKESSKKRAMRGVGDHKNLRSDEGHTMSFRRKHKGYENMEEKIENGDTILNPHGRNKRSVWEIPTKPNKAEHFAAYPDTLIRPMVLAGCPKEVCSKCGTPRYRIKEKVGEVDAPPIGGTKMANKVGEINATYSGNRTISKYETVGWSKCKCGTKFLPGIVLDPFAGTGTTLTTAYRLDRDFLGFEISKPYFEKYLTPNIKKAMKKPSLLRYIRSEIGGKARTKKLETWINRSKEER